MTLLPGAVQHGGLLREVPLLIYFIFLITPLASLKL